MKKTKFKPRDEVMLNLKEYPGVKLLARRFELASRPKKKKAKKADWSFTISHPRALNAEEIAATLDENRLVAVTTSDDPEVCCCVVVHRRIVRKAHLLGIRQSKYYITTSQWHIVIALSHAKYIKDVMAWVKRVRKAPWPEKKPVKVSVRYPEV